MNKILVVEDESRIADLLKKSLIEYGFDVYTAPDGAMGKAFIDNQHFDLIILDIILPKINGLKLCKLIRLQRPKTPIIMLTALGTTDDKLEGFDAGADDYMVKPVDLRELNARINVLLKRNIENSEDAVSVMSYEDLKLDLNAKTAIRGEKEIKLTQKEFNLLKFMMINAEKVLSRTEIAEKVWNTYFKTGTNFIDVYINYLRGKIDKNFNTKLIHTRPGIGFILKKEE